MSQQFVSDISASTKDCMYGYMAAMLPGKSVPDIARHNNWYVCCEQNHVRPFSVGCRKMLQPDIQCCHVAVMGLLQSTCSLQADVHLSWCLCCCSGLQVQVWQFWPVQCSVAVRSSRKHAAAPTLTVPPVLSGSGKNECWTDVAKTCCVLGRKRARYHHATCTLRAAGLHIYLAQTSTVITWSARFWL